MVSRCYNLPVPRRLLTIASIASVILFPVVELLWVRSYLASEWISCCWLARANNPKAGDLVPTDNYYCIRLGDGSGCWVVEYGISYQQHGVPEPRWSYHRYVPPFDFDQPGTFWGGLGFTRDVGPDGLMAITAPLWPFAFVLVALVLLHLLKRMRRERRIRQGLCEACGYNLTSNTSGTCPECGTAITARSPAAKREIE